MKHHLTRFHRLWLVSGILAVDGLFFGLSDPAKLPSYMLVVAFGLLAANIYLIIKGIIAALTWYGVPLKHERKRITKLATLLISGLIALQSIGQLSPRDLAVLFPFVVLAYGYISYGKAQPERA
jgi:hypothetical protein